MKTKNLFKTIIFLGLMVISSSTFSQEHLKFRNLPIDGKFVTFAGQLVKLGYNIVSTDQDFIYMSGQFVGKECEIFLIGTPKSKIIWKVAVFLPENKTWTSIEKEYYELKKQFITKYGEGLSFEYFKAPYESSEGYEMMAIREDKCHYVTYWQMDEGIISLRIDSSEKVRITYEDTINAAISKNEFDQRVLDDI